MNRRSFAAYLVAHVGKSLMWAASDLVTIYVLVGSYRMDAATAGALFLAGLAVNAVADVAAGAWADRHPAGTPWLAGGALVVAAASFPLTMLAAPAGPGAVLAAMAVFRIAYAGYDVPHNALLSRLATDTGVAARLSRGRTLGTGAAAALVGLGLYRARDAAALPLLLWALAGGAVLLGAALIPLLVRWPAAAPATPVGTGSDGPGLPWSFLAGSLIGIVALGAVAKAMLHLPVAVGHPDAGTTLMLLTIGRTAAALAPFGLSGGRGGLAVLAVAYGGAAAIVATLAPRGDAVALVGLGLAMGITNLIGWALLPSLARGARSYGLYTMASKLALGGGGLAMAAWLGRDPLFGPHAFGRIVMAGAFGCLVAAALVWPSRRLTLPARDPFRTP